MTFSLPRWRRLRPLAIALVSITVAGAVPVIAQKMQTVVVKKGDTLWAIAKQYLGNGEKWRAVHEVNKDTVSNPNRISPGQVLNIPGTQAAEEPVVIKETPDAIEMPVSSVEKMLRDMNARLEPLTADLAAMRARLEKLEASLGMLSEHAAKASVPVVADTAAIEKRLAKLEKALGGLLSKKDLKQLVEEHGGMQSGAVKETAAEVKALRAELGVLSKSVEAQVHMQHKAVEELNAKMSAMPMHGDQATEKKNRGIVGLVSTLAVGIAFLAVSASQ